MDKPDIEKLAKLARIEVPEDQKEHLEKDIGKILSFIDEVAQAPVSHEDVQVGTPHNTMREDGEPHEGGVFTEVLLAAAPKSEKGYVRVKKIL